MYVLIFSEREPEPTCIFRRLAISSCCASTSIWYSFARSIDMASSLFLSCERSCVTNRRMPVGLCVRSTAVSTLFTFWPPAPPDRAVEMSRSFGSMVTVTSSTSGMIAIVAVEVWMRPAVSVAGTRCTR